MTRADGFSFGVSSFLPREAGGREHPAAVRPLAPKPQHSRYFPQGEVSDATPLSRPPFSLQGPGSAAQRAGKRYEGFVASALHASGVAQRIRIAPWYRFVDLGLCPRYCQPDLVLEGPAGDATRLVVVEIKVSPFGLVDAWYQLELLYLPVLRRAHPELSIVPLAICKSFDPAVALPAEARLVQFPGEAEGGAFNVMVVR